ncbi:hypothetical protein HMPREF9120_02791 [Neisseria sp. oral taxon 020 str. F0370]|nr:hypothetical protein HMPREF9120_02791 [Neisseria sp. oral taxon 020 str. F0370]
MQILTNKNYTRAHAPDAMPPVQSRQTCHIASQNEKDTRQQAVDSTGSTTRRSNAVDFSF